MISKETYDLFYAYENMVNAEQHLSLIIGSGEVAYRSKELIKTLKRRIDVNIRDLKLILPPADAKILQDQMLDSEVTLQMRNINDMCAELPKGIRDQVEKYIESYHKVYKQKIA